MGLKIRFKSNTFAKCSLKRENRIKLNSFLRKTKASALILSGGEDFGLNKERIFWKSLY